MCQAIPPLPTVCLHGVLRNSILFCVTYILCYNLPHNYNFSPLSFQTLSFTRWFNNLIYRVYLSPARESQNTCSLQSVCVHSISVSEDYMPSPINLNESKKDCSSRIPYRLLSVNSLQLLLGRTGFTKYVTLPLNVCPSGFKLFFGCQMHLKQLVLTILHQHQLSCLLWSSSENKILAILYTFVYFLFCSM
jgi:hypothetical protein